MVLSDPARTACARSSAAARRPPGAHRPGAALLAAAVLLLLASGCAVRPPAAAPVPGPASASAASPAPDAPAVPAADAVAAASAAPRDAAVAAGARIPPPVPAPVAAAPARPGRASATPAAVSGGSATAAAAAAASPAPPHAASRDAPDVPYAFPDYDSAAAIDAACSALLADLKRREAALAAMSPRDGAAVPAALDALQRRIGDTIGPLAVLVAVHPDKALRDAGERCDLAVDAFDAAFRQNARVHSVLRRVRPADDIDRAYLRREIEQFEDAGVALAPAARERARAISLDITRQTQAFERRLRENRTRVAFAADELRGVPEAVWKDAPRDAEGRLLLGLDYPTVGPVMERAESAAARERMWRAFNDRGGADNLAVLVELGRLRRAYARLFGLDSWADYALRRRMAQSTRHVRDFLAEVRSAVAARERADLDELRAEKARHLGSAPESTTLARWDISYYSERIRQARYAVDQEQFRRHFPPQASVDFVFALAERLFGVAFVAAPPPPWHAEARAYAVRDSASGKPLGTLFVDLYPRADKYGHAAVWSFRVGSTLARRLPAAALVVNFSRQGLTIDELETLLHEFGHALHTLASTTRYAGNGGTHVRRDFIEAPSQMLEDWVYDPAVLALFRQVCASCPPVPDELLAQADRARHFAKGIAVGRQWLLASYDLAYYAAAPADPLALWAAMEAATPLGHVAGSRFPAAFGHIAGGYAAGYYGYLWSLVVAEDLRTAFAPADGGAGRLDAATGARYRRSVLARGGEVEPAELVRRFLGRPTDSRAFFRALDRR